MDVGSGVGSAAGAGASVGVGLTDYEDRDAWSRRMLVNIARSGFFSSDRTIAEYDQDIWHLK